MHKSQSTIQPNILVRPPEPAECPRDRAKGWLRDLLSGGSVPASDVLLKAFAAGISKRTLIRAKRAIGVVSKKAAFGGPWNWTLAPEPKDSTTNKTPITDNELRLLRVLLRLRAKTGGGICPVTLIMSASKCCGGAKQAARAFGTLRRRELVLEENQVVRLSPKGAAALTIQLNGKS